MLLLDFFFFFSSRRRHTRFDCDWSSDVCSSDLAILASELGLDPKATMGFAMALSEACQNIVEHAGTGGWVAVQAYHWPRRLARRGAGIGAADPGVGVRHSLEPTQRKRFGARWEDAAAR